VCVGDRLGYHIVGPERPNERDALRRAESQIKTMHAAFAEHAPVCTIGRDPVVEPTGDQLRVSFPARALSIGQTDQPGNGVSVAGQQPNRGAGFAFGVVLPQPAADPCQIPGSVCGDFGAPVRVAALAVPQPFSRIVQMCRAEIGGGKAVENRT
jgi:hypothetical protein